MFNFNYGVIPSLYLCLLLIPHSVISAELITSIRDLSPFQIIYPTAFGSQLGASVTSLEDFDGDGLLDFAIGAPGFEGIHTGRLQDQSAVFVVYGKSLQSGPIIDLSQENNNSTLITGNQQFPLGISIAGAGDINGDGFSDLAAGTSNGNVGIVYLGRNNPPSRHHLDEIGFDIIKLQNTGKSASFGGDFNGDGFKDVVFGSPTVEQIIQGEQVYHFGAFTLLFGNLDFLNNVNVLVPNQKQYFTSRGTPDCSYADYVSGGIDLNSDGFSEIIITAANPNPSQTGEGYIIFGGENQFANGKAEYGLTLHNIAGYVTSCGDVNADGYPELIAGLPDNQAVIIKGRKNLHGTIDLSKNPQNWGTLITGAERVYSVGDLNGDGFSDTAAAMPYAKFGNQMMTGQVLFLFGRPEMPEVIDIGKIQQGQLVAIDYVLVNGLEAFDTFGASIAGIGDIQNDGFGEVVIGAPTQQLPGDSIQKRPGSAYLIQGIELYYAMQTHRSTFSQRGQKQ